MGPRLLLPLAVVALTLVWVVSASAVSISLTFTEVEGANIVVGGVPGIGDVPPLPGVPVTVTTSPELATVTGGIQTSSIVLSAFVAVLEPGSTTDVSDAVGIQVFAPPTGGIPVGFQVSFQSDTEAGLSGSFTGFIPETGLMQLAIDHVGFVLPPDLFVDVTVHVQSDIDVPVPEPSTLALFASGMLGLAGALWRRHLQG